MSTTARPAVVIFRPNDERLEAARGLLEELGVEPITDSLLEIVPTGQLPRRDADMVILTSRTGARLLDRGNWQPAGATVCAIGEATATALESAGYRVQVTPGVFSSAGLLDAIRDDVDGRRIEVARSDHGSPLLVQGLMDAGAFVHETILYELRRPQGSGTSTELLAAGELDAVLFTSSLTVEHFLEAAAERGISREVLRALDGCVVGAIGEPTRRSAEERGIDVDVIPPTADFEELATAAIARVRARRTEG